MPLPRRKACDQCRSAKARCSLSLPCMRCSQRNIRCEYAPSTRRQATGVHTEIRPLRSNSTRPSASTVSSTPRGSLDVGVNGSFTGPMAYSLSYLSSPLMPSPLVIGTPNGDWDLDFGVLDDLRLPTGTNINEACLDASVNASSSTLSGEGEPPPSPPWTGPGPGLSPEQAQPGHEPDRVLGPGASFSVWAGRTYLHSPLSRRNLSRAPQTLLTTKLLLGQISKYPKMMIQGTRLPPFIYPPCTMDFQAEQICAGSHRCLPEALAICSTLIRSFYERTPQTSSFVWRMIYSEQRRLHREYHGYDEAGVLEALQAIIIYTLLQAQDPDSIERNGAIALIITSSDLSLRLQGMISDCGVFTDPRTVNRQLWIQRESIRRTFFLLFVVELLLDAILNPTHEACAGYLEIPLPCVRQLWEPVPDSEWRKRYSDLYNDRTTDTPITLETVRLAKGTNDYSLVQARDREKLKDLGSWCENVDDFGTLIWMASMLW